MLVWLVVASSCQSTDQVAPAPPATGYRALFMGHSFFEPVTRDIAEHARRAGFSGHVQDVYYSAGVSGSPEGLWTDTGHQIAIQSILATGDIGLVGMTYHSAHPTPVGYRRWIEYALQHNPNAAFFIAAPWPRYPADSTQEEYDAIWRELHATIHDIIDGLRAEFPDTVIFCIPYGLASLELKQRFEADALPDVSTLIGGVYADALGHPLDILLDLSELIWLSAIYGVELDDYPHDPGYLTDLKGLAHELSMTHEVQYNSPWNR